MAWWLLYGVGAVVIAVIEFAGVYSEKGVPDPWRIAGAFVFPIFWPVLLPLAIIVGIWRGVGDRLRRGRELRSIAND